MKKAVVAICLLSFFFCIPVETQAGIAQAYVIVKSEEKATESTVIITVADVGTFLRQCNDVETSSLIPTPATVAIGGKFFVIGGFVSVVDLPPDPGATGKLFIGGIDSDGDCVRDDVERYIVQLLPNLDQRVARKHLYEYVRWRGRFMNSQPSGFTAEVGKEISNYMYISANCFKAEMHDDIKSDEIINKVFAQFLNTYDRTFWYLDNLSLLAGWTTREDITVSCQ